MSLRMMDFRCPACDRVYLDILLDTDAFRAPECCGIATIRFLSRPPTVDAREPFYDKNLGQTFTSFHQADRYAKEHGSVNLPLGETPKVKTTEDRIRENRPKVREAVQKSYYRLKHGYQDHPKLEKDDSPA